MPLPVQMPYTPPNLPPGFTQSGTQGAYIRDVQGNELTSNALNGLTAQNNPYMQQARLSGQQQANSRGLLNSSIAAGNSQQAAIQAALPIATQDAQAYRDAAGQNQQYLNQLEQANISAGAQMESARISSGAAGNTAQINADAALQRQREQLAYSGEQSGLDRSFQDYMSSMGYGQQLGLQSAGIGGQALIQNLGFQGQSGLASQQYGYQLGSQNNQTYNQGLLANQQYGQQLGLAQQNQGFTNQNMYNQYQYGLGTQNNLYSNQLNNTMQTGLLGVGANLLYGQQQFANSAGLAAMNNPGIMQDPAAFGGYMQWLSAPFSNITNSIFGNLFPTQGNP